MNTQSHASSITIARIEHRGERRLGLYSFYSGQTEQQVIIQHARKADITKRVTPHELRHRFAIHLLDNGMDVRFIQDLPGHKDLKKTMIYTHITTRTLESIESPLDRIPLGDDSWKKENNGKVSVMVSDELNDEADPTEEQLNSINFIPDIPNKIEQALFNALEIEYPKLNPSWICSPQPGPITLIGSKRMNVKPS